MYDIENYTKKVDELTAAGDPSAVEQFILDELRVVDTPYCIGSGGCPSCRSQEKEDRDALQWLHDRVTAQVILRNDLAGLYRSTSRWDDCMTVFEQLMENLEEAGLLETPLHGRILLNRALLERQLERLNDALADAEHAQACFETAPEVATEALRQAIETVAACKSALGK